MNRQQLNRLMNRLVVTLVVLLIALATTSPVAAAPGPVKAAPFEIVLVQPEAVTPGSISQWKQEGFKAVAVVLDERASEAVYRAAGRQVSDGGLDLYCWIEVARNPGLAAAHPRWMAALGMHEDWQKNFSNLPEPKTGEVAKAFPWVPIGYREAFEAHLKRIEQLLKRAPSGWRGLLLNDLQAGPSSCGCGNLLCRWAIDYDVRPTATKLEGDDVAARFIAEVRKRVGEKSIIPVWTTECEEVDLPAKNNQGRPGTGLCGTVGCAVGTCPRAFTRQWSAITAGNDGSVGLLALPTALQRTQKEFGGGPGWVTNAMTYLQRTVPANGGKMIASDRLWVVVDDSPAAGGITSRKLAAQAGVGAVIVARTSIDQSYEPRMIPVK